jgi:hypothetical protein
MVHLQLPRQLLIPLHRHQGAGVIAVMLWARGAPLPVWMIGVRTTVVMATVRRLIAYVVVPAVNQSSSVGHSERGNLWRELTDGALETVAKAIVLRICVLVGNRKVLVLGCALFVTMQCPSVYTEVVHVSFE